MKRVVIRLSAIVALTVCGYATPLVGQEDFRSADPGRPILVEDAYPLKFREWELELGIRGDVSQEGRGVEGVVELKSGLFLNGHAGLEVEAGSTRAEEAAGAVSGVEAVRGHILYNLGRETWNLPAFAARIDVSTPGTGRLGDEDWGVGATAIATRSFGRFRIHSNAGYVVASAVDGGDYWRLGLAFDFPVGLFSKALMGDVYAELPTSSGRARVWAELGMRWQVSNVNVVDFGIASRLDEWEAGNANLELILGLSRVFGLEGHGAVPPDLNPRID